MNRVSSQWTIIIRIFIPTVWVTAILSVLILLGWAIRGKAGLLSNPFIWVALLIIFLTGFVIIRFLLWRIYRIDFDATNVYISNYFKTYKYPIRDIESIDTSAVWPSRIRIIRLKAKGSFGKNIPFMTSSSLWEDYVAQHPDTIAPLLRDASKN